MDASTQGGWVSVRTKAQRSGVLYSLSSFPSPVTNSVFKWEEKDGNGEITDHPLDHGKGSVN